MMWSNRARGLMGRGGYLASLIIPGWQGSASANANCKRYLGSAISVKNSVREAMRLRQPVSPIHLQNRQFSSANELGVQHQEGAPVHQGKLPFIDAFLFKMKNNPKLLMNKKIWSRRSMILPEFVNINVRIYNGKSFIRRKITESMVGHKFGEFAFTRKRMKLKTSTVKKKAKKA